MTFTERDMIAILGKTDIEDLDAGALDAVQDFVLTALGADSALFKRCTNERFNRLFGE